MALPVAYCVTYVSEEGHTISALRAGMPACGIYGAKGWREVYRTKFRRRERVYIAFDRDAVDKGIALAREFGVRSRSRVQGRRGRSRRIRRGMILFSPRHSQDAQ